jgi:uncharacterized protein involved in exopolysaccharide biosynthesis
MDIHYYWRVFRRHLPYVLILAVIGAGVGVAIALALPPVYRAEAILIVESEQIPDELAASTVKTGEIEALQIIRQRILSREILLELANEQKLFTDDPTLSADDKVKDLRERIDIITAGGSGRGPQTATIVTVGFRDAIPQLSARTANEVVTLILQENVRMRTNVARQTQEFFTQEVDRLELALSGVSSRILNFQENNLEALPDSLEFRRSQQAAIQERLLQLRREKNALQDRRDQLVTLFEATGQTGLETRGGVTTLPRQRARPEEQQLADLRREYDRLSATLSPSNPRMGLLLSQISAAEAAVAALPAESAPLGGTDERSLEMSLFDLRVADINAQIRYIEDQSNDAQARMAAISKTIEETPGNAVTLATMERDYENLQEQYNLAVANKARAETGSMIESLSRGQRISVVEPAIAPEQPNSPNRPLIAVGGLIGGLATGILIFLGLELTNTSVRRPQDLERKLQITAFETIPYMTTHREVHFKRVSMLVTLGVLFVGVPLALWYVDQNISPLQPLFERILEKAGLGKFL